MKQITIFILSTVTVFTVLISCKKSTASLTIVDGTYIGTFQRQVAGTGNIANVSLVFNAGNWVGQSATPKYPALCSGEFKTSNTNEIAFFESCVWTADFDWTLILNQKYTLQIAGNKYMLTKDYGNGTKDIYNLTKQ